MPLIQRRAVEDRSNPRNFAASVRPGLLAALVLSLVGCPAPVVNTAPPKKPEPAKVVITHVAPAEATAANAAASRCSLQSEQVGALAKDGSFAIGFGQQGGLVAWSGPEGVRAKPLTSAGKTGGPGVSIAFPRGSDPAEIAPLGQGFVILAKRTEYVDGMCPGKCTDATCAGWPAGKPQPHVCKSKCEQPCKRPSAINYFVQYTDLEGHNATAGMPFRTGPEGIVAAIAGDGKSMAFITGKDIIWIRTRPDGKIESERIEMPAAKFVLPVRGNGPPTLLLAEENGSLEVVEERKTREVTGSLVDKKSGRLVDARLQSRWGADNHIHVARQAWMVSLDSIQYAHIENYELRYAGEPQGKGFREPFAEYVEPHLVDGRFRRSSWLQKAVGEDIDLQNADAAADVSNARFAWSGSVFVFVYLTRPAHREAVRAVGIVAADCAGGAK